VSPRCRGRRATAICSHGKAHGNFEAVLFDLDGVLTSTAALHARCWKATFDELPLLEPFDIEHDYLAHVDGKPRYDGVRDFLASRGIALAEEQVRQIGDRKQALVERGLDGPGFRVQVRGQVIEVDMTPDGTDYRLVEGRGLLIFEGDKPIRLVPEVEALAA
jgi:phosphoglycolate phosphatase-like HAD superfamily hydrolase